VVRLSTSCISNVLAGKPPKHDNFTSRGGPCVVAMQELLSPLLAHVLFLGCTVGLALLGRIEIIKMFAIPKFMYKAFLI